MSYSFDRVIDRRGTDSVKYDLARVRGMPADVLPLWVADMDFPSPPEVLQALEEKCRHGIFGYGEDLDGDYFGALSGWYASRFGWELSPAWLVKTPGIVFAVSTAVRALTDAGDAVLIQEPVYHPFSETIRANGRTPVVNALAFDGKRYTVDLADFERKITQNKVRLFILCSPHNPVGRVWTAAELSAMGEICLKHGVRVVSDEIHADFVFPGHRHTVFASLGPAFAELSITCTAPTKTFNLAGLQISNILIPNAEIRGRFRSELKKTGFSGPNVMGLAACRAAYRCGGPWLDELLGYLASNLALVRSFLRERLPQLRLIEPEGTYLLWLDCRALGLTDRELDDWLVRRAGLWLDGGTMFGRGGEGFQRVNIACPRSLLQTALERLETAAAQLEANVGRGATP